MLKRWTSPTAPVVGIGLAVVAAVAVFLAVDLTPRVEGDFFFAEDDPQMRASLEVERRFPLADQLVLRVEDRGLEAEEGLADPAYRARVDDLTDALLDVEGVTGGFSVATDDPSSPLFGRILLTPEAAATNIVLQVDETDPEILLPRVEAVVDAHEGEELDVVVSGVPAIVELIRRSLFQDLVVFSTAAVVVFALLMAVIYRDAAVVVGTLTTCLLSVGATLLVVTTMDVGIGLLTANLVTIVFVLTLSHVVFLTANWRRVAGRPDPGSADPTRPDDGRLPAPERGEPQGPEGGGGDSDADGDAAVAIRAARSAWLARTLRDTFEGSFWSMATTALGFASLLLASARPLRELGLAGLVGAGTALVVAYGVYPAFLGSWAGTGRSRAGGATPAERDQEADRSGDGSSETSSTAGASISAHQPSGSGPVGRGRWVVPTAATLVVAMGAGVLRIDTDPGLLTYFAAGSELREGLSRIDADGGSSTLDVVVADPRGRPVHDPDVFPRLQALQESMEADSAAGVVLSPAVLIEHARTIPLAAFFPVESLLNIASSEAMDRVGRAFVSEDRSEGRFSLRMRESSTEDRDVVLDRIRADVDGAGLETVIVAGLYDLQARLGRLIASSLRVGIGGLLLLFLGIAAAVSRSAWTTTSMWLCLISIPAVTLGAFGHLGVALDLITSPSANIALAIGADSMIHLVVRVRRLAAAGIGDSWAVATSQIAPPILGATVVVSAGFGIFVLSSFPPTQRFGMAVIVGTLTAAIMAVVVLPRLALLNARKGTS